MSFGLYYPNIQVMDTISINNFLNSEQDWELKQYTILSLIQSYQKNFKNLKLYPSLASLMHLSSVLKNLVKNKDSINVCVSKEIKLTGIKNKNVLIKNIKPGTGDIKDLQELVKWSLPQIESILNEGMIIYNFVYENITLSLLNDCGVTGDSGYLVIPDNKSNNICLIHYELVLFKNHLKPEKTLRTTLIRTYKNHDDKSLTDLKNELKLLNHSGKEKPVFSLNTDLDFPFSETILPIAKRKLLNLF